MKFLKSLFGRKTSAHETLVVSAPPVKTLPDWCWTPDTTMPIPNWDLVERTAPDDAVALGAFWRDAADAWLQALSFNLGEGFAIAGSEHFLLLSSLSARQRRLAIDFSERAHRRILKTLDGVARAAGHRPHVVIVFDDIEQYHEYLLHYVPDEDDKAMSAGMFINRGYGHYIFVKSDLDRMEPIVAHELTHALVSHLPIPLWLNEGTAVNTEKHLVPHLASPRNALYTPREMERRHAKFWNARTIQEYWAGTSFRRPDEGAELSYDLAERMVKLLAEDYPRYRTLLNTADAEDAGDAALLHAYGFDLTQLATAILGEGHWRPRPDAWDERSVETGNA
ncbi:hypothetical protein [Tahibacter soli]|uniref:Peptidase MA-like domain-containing protein n=1 Tax=Tahibacter soli TaxID=2983605 RepID=A0A9X3YMR2_9GAMM|nr:hypothetical protein [Tahibacter soli]MDC8015172.1 hypothetical protein [Tahibacter soli]